MPSSVEDELCKGFVALPFHDDFSGEPIPMTPITTKALRNGLESLPQEMYDMIYNHVFHIEPHSEVITKAYKPPIQLQISSKTRARAMQSYYGANAVWVFENPDEAKYLIHSWFASLPPAVENYFRARCVNGTCQWHFHEGGWALHVYQLKQTGRTKPFLIEGLWLH
ncbi:uncharacterized protein RCC_08713 [Ramularia collo-cygni]|uniref:Uncharacterized protein n=1 Tax=Ramularia collo-cygni TaxID=112498 RepID=A0A2D3VBG1_9PEZI|nr:uncharacterized protein RCC_08713 [Ramularia collo-cygni]CZT23005.1 uncharacterized protein RCC_08713 [Ramularia collo-cygni]